MTIKQHDPQNLTLNMQFGDAAVLCRRRYTGADYSVNQALIIVDCCQYSPSLLPTMIGDDGR
ncbi:MAG TPA: hypothetical protein V6D19_14855 [Stenomitos sp.]